MVSNFLAQRAGATRCKRSTKVTKAATPGRRRTPDEVAELGERFYRVLCESPGESMPVLAARIGVTPRELHRSVVLLRRAGRVRTVGQRRATRYFPTVKGAKAA